MKQHRKKWQQTELQKNKIAMDKEDLEKKKKRKKSGKNNNNSIMK